MTMNQLKKWEEERVALKIKMDERLDELVEIENKFKAIKTAFPVLTSYIEVGDKTGIQSATEVINEILQSSRKVRINDLSGL